MLVLIAGYRGGQGQGSGGKDILLLRWTGNKHILESTSQSTAYR